VVRLRYPHEEVYLASSPESIRQVLTDHADNYHKGYDSLDVVLGRGVVLTEGREWQACRARARAGFSEDHLRRFGDAVGSSVDALLDRWEGRSSFDAEADMVRLAQDAIADWMFGAPMDSSVGRSLSVLRECMSSPEGARSPRFGSALDTLDRWVLGFVRRGACGGALDPLLSAGSERQIRDEVISLFIPGYETSSSMLSWILHFLSVDPELQDRVRSQPEVRTRMIEETVRFYPPACSFARRAIAADRLSGVPIPAGAKVVVSPYVTHHLPSLWPDPEEFKPERFERRPAPGSYLPFGAGPRICIGARMAMALAEIVTSRVAARWRLKARRPGSVTPHAAVTLRPRRGVWISAESRS